jgi:hypothetical protein
MALLQENKSLFLKHPSTGSPPLLNNSHMVTYHCHVKDVKGTVWRDVTWVKK